MRKLSLFLVLNAWILMPAFPAYAYLDPGTGSMILQILLGGFAGAAVILKLHWFKIKSFFVREKPENSNTNEE